MINIKDTINDSVEVKQLMLNDCLNEIELAVGIMIESALIPSILSGISCIICC